MDVPPEFDHDYAPARIVYGRGTAARLGDVLADAGASRALLVTGSSVGANDDLMDPVRAGLGDGLAGHFDGTTPAKAAAEAYEGRDAMADCDADAIVAVGGGSTLDVAKGTRILDADYRSPADLRAEAASGESLAVHEGAMVPLIAVPTTLAGADLSIGGSLSLAATEDDPAASVGISDRKTMPTACVYDPALVETTPFSVLAGSAPNGYDKGVEMLYSANATAITDATAMRGLRLFQRSLPTLAEGDPADYDRAVAGAVLVQYGLSTPGGGLFSLLHAFGHGLSRDRPVQQGVAHAVVAPAALSHLFDHVDGRRDLLAEAVEADGDPAEGVVEAVRRVRDGLGLPSRLRDVEGVTREDLHAVAVATHEDGIMANCPEGYDPSVAAVEEILEAAW
ncbi:MAG: iron-containing alcohol dehydrogenase family protein [Haloplanus sp.]